MRSDYPADLVPATPEYVLSVIRDSHRQQCQIDVGADPTVELSFETTIAAWWRACDMTWELPCDALNDYWSISATHGEWREILEPMKQRTLGHLCQFIASRAKRPVIRPARFFGAPCATAGAFLTLRSLLAQHGAKAQEIAPSTLLAPYAREYAAVFLGPVAKLAPGKLPDVSFRSSGYTFFAICFFVGLILTVVGHWLSPCVIIEGVAFAAIGWFGMLIASRWNPTSASFGSLITFRDLAIALTSA